MAENVAGKTVFSLSDVMRSVQKTIATRYTTSFWVKAEMNKLNYYRHSGHCYPDLVDKKDGKIVAEVRSVLWNSDFARINRKFQSVLKEPLKDGIKILFNAKVQFDPKYGLSLLILDIDPSFTLGDLEREKQDTIQKLKAENLFTRNKQTLFPMLPQRIAIISVDTSKGYADFLSVVGNNTWKYRFFHLLFPSLLQGDRASGSIINQLKRIKKAARYFDVVAIIRGGGGEVGLSCYNDYELARAICEFPIPVITGIGHATNETVSEMVAHTNAITPTKLAELLLQRFHDFARPVQQAENDMIEISKRILSEKKASFRSMTRLFKSVSSRVFVTHGNQLNEYARSVAQQATHMFVRSGEQLRAARQQILMHTNYLFKEKTSKVEAMEKNVGNLHPDNVLKRGYSITLVNGKVVREIEGIKEGQLAETRIFGGQFTSIVKDIKPKTKTNE